MKVLLLAMPNTVDIVDFFIQVPNLALVSLAAQIPEHEVKVQDLLAYGSNIRKPLEDILESFKPQVVGLSAMTFQFDTLIKVAKLIKNKYPDIKIIAGGYHVTLLYKKITSENVDLPMDFIVRGEGEITFKELINELEKNNDNFEKISGLSYKNNGKWKHNIKRNLTDLSDIKIPTRKTRIVDRLNLLDMPIDVIETSRGCPNNCNFCSITHMYGQTFRTYSEERIIADLMNIQALEKQVVFITDDNITCNINHFRRLCKIIKQNGFDNMQFAVQVTAAGIANNPKLVSEMADANFKFVFVGFESMLPDVLKQMKKPTSPNINRKAAKLLNQHAMSIVAGCIVGYPDDTKKSIKQSCKLVRKLKPDIFYSQLLTPFPKTKLRQELKNEGLIVNLDNYQTYDGMSCNIRTRHLSQKTLFRTYHKELLKCYFDWSMISDNYFLKKKSLQLFSASIKCIIEHIRNVLTGKRKNISFDI